MRRLWRRTQEVLLYLKRPRIQDWVSFLSPSKLQSTLGYLWGTDRQWYKQLIQSNTWMEMLTPSVNHKVQEELIRARSTMFSRCVMRTQPMSSMLRRGSAVAGRGRSLVCHVCMLLYWRVCFWLVLQILYHDSIPYRLWYVHKSFSRSSKYNICIQFLVAATGIYFPEFLFVYFALDLDNYKRRKIIRLSSHQATRNHNCLAYIISIAFVESSGCCRLITRKLVMNCSLLGEFECIAMKLYL